MSKVTLGHLTNKPMNPHELKREVLTALYRNRAIELIEAGYTLEDACDRAIKEGDAKLELNESTLATFKTLREPIPF